METTTQVSYDFTEKYFQILPEGRIRRKQYFYRMIIGGIVAGILYSILMTFLGQVNIDAFTAIASPIIALICLFMWYIHNTKRIRDIGKDPKIVQRVTIGLMIWSFLYSVYEYIGEQGWISGYVSSLDKALAKFGQVLGSTELSVVLPWHQMVMDSSMYIYYVILIGLFLYLLLIPGKAGDNDFGKDPINTKIGFFG